MKIEIKIRITVFLVVSLVLLLFASVVLAQPGDLELVGKASGLLLVPPEGMLFNLMNMNPGDNRHATLSIKNDYSKWCDLWLRAEGRTDQEPGLLEQLELTVMYKGTQLYKGSMTDFGKGNIYLGRYSPGDKGDLLASVYLPGPETNNCFQGKSANVKWIFTARAGIPPEEPPIEPPVEPPVEPPIEPPVEPPVEPSVESPEEIEIVPEPVPLVSPKMPKTGEESPYPYYVLGGVALLGGVSLAGLRRRR